ncbi:MAG: hypothetical protein ABII09_01630 [Planctomycetota bacterium]
MDYFCQEDTKGFTAEHAENFNYCHENAQKAQDYSFLIYDLQNFLATDYTDFRSGLFASLRVTDFLPRRTRRVFRRRLSLIYAVFFTTKWHEGTQRFRLAGNLAIGCSRCEHLRQPTASAEGH